MGEAPANYVRDQLPDGVRLTASEGASPRAIAVVLLAAWLLPRAAMQLRFLAAGVLGPTLVVQLAFEALVGYLAVAVFANRTVLELRGRRVSWTVAPLPIPGAEAQAVEGVTGFSIRTIPAPRRRPGPPWLELRAAVEGGPDRPVGRPFPERARAEVEYLLAQLQGALA